MKGKEKCERVQILEAKERTGRKSVCIAKKETEREDLKGRKAKAREGKVYFFIVTIGKREKSFQWDGEFKRKNMTLEWR